jgi:hypothetical protein
MGGSNAQQFYMFEQLHMLVAGLVSVIGTSHAARSSSSHRAPATRSSSRTPTFSDDEDDDAQGDEQEELGGSKLDDAPPATQPAQRRRQPPRRHTPSTDALGKARGKCKANGVILELWGHEIVVIHM